MKVIKYLSLGFVMLSVFHGHCYAVDPSVFWGTWKTQGGEVAMKILVKGRKAVYLEINGKKIENVEHDYVYSKLRVALPFFCLYAREGDVEHSIYLTIGNDKGLPTLNRLKGFYELGELLYLHKKTDEDHGGDMRITIYPLEFIRESEEQQSESVNK